MHYHGPLRGIGELPLRGHRLSHENIESYVPQILGGDNGVLIPP